MAPNKAKYHVYVLAEDDANRQLAVGFHGEVHPSQQRQMQVLEEAGGWTAVLKRFISKLAPQMYRNSLTATILLIDFDGNTDRRKYMMAKISSLLHDRTFILGALSDPEGLKEEGLGSYRAIGSKLASDCRNGATDTWGHHLLQHNIEEVRRLSPFLRPMLLGP